MLMIWTVQYSLPPLCKSLNFWTLAIDTEDSTVGHRDLSPGAVNILRGHDGVMMSSSRHFRMSKIHRVLNKNSLHTEIPYLTSPRDVDLIVSCIGVYTNVITKI